MSMCGICWFDGRALTDERDDLRVRVSERDARISELKKLIPLVEEVRANHRDPQSGEYNECEKSPCMWCDLAQKAIDAARKED